MRSIRLGSMIAVLTGLTAATAVAAPDTVPAQSLAWIPEPFTLATLALGAVCLLLRRRAP